MSTVLIDTSVWIDYLKRGESAEAEAVARVLESRKAVTAGIVLAELLQGARSDQQEATLELLLKALPLLQENWETWSSVGKNARSLRGQGIIVPITDLVLAQLAIENDCLLFSRDSHFNHIPNLKRYVI